MFTLFLGLFLISGILYWSIQSDFNVYLQLHSFVVVVVGTIAVLFYSTPFKVLKNLWQSIQLLFKNEEHFADFTTDLTKISKNRNVEIKESHPLINYASQLWAQGLDPDLFVPLLSQKRRDLETKETDAVMALKSLNKYPPALGMAGTVMGMITLFTNLDTSKDKIGVSLSIAMTATFFGLILSNMLISPLADRLQLLQASNLRVMDNLYEVLLLINRNEADSLVAEEMRDRAG